MNLQPIIQSEVKSEREKQVSYINAYVWNLEGYWWAYLQGSNGDAKIENRLMDTEGKGEGGKNWTGSTEALTLPHVKWRASGNLLYDGGSSNPVLCDNLQGWDGMGGKFKREGTYVWLIHADVWQKPTQYCKTIVLQLKNKELI